MIIQRGDNENSPSSLVWLFIYVCVCLDVLGNVEREIRKQQPQQSPPPSRR